MVTGIMVVPGMVYEYEVDGEGMHLAFLSSVIQAATSFSVG